MTSPLESDFQIKTPSNLKIGTKYVVNVFKALSLSLGIFKLKITYFGVIFLGFNMPIQKAKVAKTTSSLMEKVSIELQE